MAVAVGVFTFVQSIRARNEQKRQAGIENEKRAVEKRQAELSKRRQRQIALAEAARARASIRAQETQQIGVGSTSSAGAQARGQITSSINSQIGFGSQLQGLQDQITQLTDASYRSQEKQANISAETSFVKAGAGLYNSYQNPSLNAGA